MKKIDETSLEFDKQRGCDAFIPADEATMACCLRDDVIVKSVHEYATVEIKGGVTQGQMVVDWRRHFKKDANVEIVEKMDKRLYESLIYKAFDP